MLIELFFGDLLSERPAFHADALCKEHPEVNFYPERGESADPAKAVCARCTVQAECLAWVLEHEPAPPLGIWAGLSARQRRPLHLARAAAPRLPARPSAAAGTLAGRCTWCDAPTTTGRYARLCRPCGDFQAVHGQLPPQSLLEARLADRPITVLEQARTARRAGVRRAIEAAPTDVGWLMERRREGATMSALAAEAGCSVAEVRTMLHGAAS